MKPNILLIVIDSFNTKKFFGETKTSVTPTIDYLIKNGTYFNKAITVATTTIPSISSVFTGLYPSQSVKKTGNFLKINNNVENYIQKLRDHGYNTHAIVPKIISLANLNSIFNENIEEFDSFATLYDGVGEKILKKINSSQKNPWFYYVHLMDIHGDATFHLGETPKKYQNHKFGKNRYERMVSAMDSWLQEIIEKIDLDNTLVVLTADHGSFTANYDQDMEKQNDISNKKRETIESNSYKIGYNIFTNLPSIFNPLRKFISKKYIKKRNKTIDLKLKLQLENIDFSGLSEYKKRLLKDSVNSSTKLFDDICRIPLLFFGVKVPKKIISHQVKNIDIFPTIFDLIGLKNELNASNQSLVPLMEGLQVKDSDVFIYSVTNSDDDVVVGIRTNEFKYFRKINESINSALLFDLKNDPYEEINLIKEKQDLVLKLEQKLTRFLKLNLPYNENLNEYEDEQIKAELKKLGYL